MVRKSGMKKGNGGKVAVLGSSLHSGLVYKGKK